MSRNWMVYCPKCDGRSSCTYRCDCVVDETSDGQPIECGTDLAGEPVRPFRYPTDVGRRDDGLVKVRFPMTCLDCGDRRLLPLQYTHVGQVIRIGCLSCDEATKHRPTDEAVRYQIHRMGLADGIDTDDQFDDHNPTVSTPT